MSRVRTRKRRTTMLNQVLGSDLLTWREKLIKEETSGLYSLANEQAYFKIPGDVENMSIASFERKLRTELDDNFRVVFNNMVSSAEHLIQGHSIYFLYEPCQGYVKVMNVGLNNNNIIPAESQGRVISYKGDDYNAGEHIDEEAILYRGWVAAFEGCKLAYEDWERLGISAAMCINEREIYVLNEAFKVPGFQDYYHKAINAVDDILHLPEVLHPIVKTEESIKEEIKAEVI